MCTTAHHYCTFSSHNLHQVCNSASPSSHLHLTSPSPPAFPRCKVKMPQQRNVVLSSDLAARQAARQSRPRPWAQSQPSSSRTKSQSTSSRIRNRPALQPPVQSTAPTPAAKPPGRRVVFDDKITTFTIPTRWIPDRTAIPRPTFGSSVRRHRISTITPVLSLNFPGTSTSRRQPQRHLQPSRPTLKRAASKLSCLAPADGSQVLVSKQISPAATATNTSSQQSSTQTWDQKSGKQTYLAQWRE